MPEFTVSRTYTMPKDEARRIAENLAQDIETQYGLRARWQGDSATMRGSGVDGVLAIDDDVIRVKVSMGLMASMFERPLRRIVTQYLDDHVS